MAWNSFTVSPVAGLIVAMLMTRSFSRGPRRPRTYDANASPGAALMPPVGGGAISAEWRSLPLGGAASGAARYLTGGALFSSVARNRAEWREISRHSAAFRATQSENAPLERFR